jgi:hypothetical protein
MPLAVLGRSASLSRVGIVEGAVGMVEEALEKMRERNIVSLDEEREATMVSNLMVVLCTAHAEDLRRRFGGEVRFVAGSEATLGRARRGPGRRG